MRISSSPPTEGFHENESAPGRDLLHLANLYQIV